MSKYKVGDRVLYRCKEYKIIGIKKHLFTTYLLKSDSSTDRITVPAVYAEARSRKLWSINK